MTNNLNGFTKAENSIIFNNDISPQAFRLYLQFKYYAYIPKFKVCKSLMIKVSGLVDKTFDKYWKELKDLGLIKINSERCGKKNLYWFSLIIHKDIDKLDVISNDSKKAVNEKLSSSRQNNILDEIRKKLSLKDKKESKSEELYIDKRGENTKLIEGKTTLKLSKWQRFVAERLDKGMVLRTITEFLKRKGRTFTFFTDKYLDVLAHNGKEIKEDLIELLKKDECFIPIIT